MNFKGNVNIEDSPRILVVGASGRMTAAMLSRLGFTCSVADLFADRDTRMICEGRVTRLDRLNKLNSYEQLVRSHDYVVFAGGLEGKPRLAERVSRWTGRAFTSPVALEKFNDYEVLNKAMESSGLERYPFQRNPMKVTLPAIAKSLRGSGRSTLTRHWLDCAKGVFRGRVFQDRIDGECVSLIFVGNGRSAKGLGGSTQICQSLVWNGSVSGLELSETDQEASIHLANNLVEHSGIEGVFGIDFIRNKGGLWPIDFNPRIPASAEIVGDHVMQEHMTSFGTNVGLEKAEPTIAAQGKLVVFNRTSNPIRFELRKIPDFPMRHQSSSSETSVADVPVEGESIKPGHPILTVFVSRENRAEVQADLQRKSDEILQRLSQ
jgi:predicted ATP-grasp superfamily ATP-dependent carboligase